MSFFEPNADESEPASDTAADREAERIRLSREWFAHLRSVLAGATTKGPTP